MYITNPRERKNVCTFFSSRNCFLLPFLHCKTSQLCDHNPTQNRPANTDRKQLRSVGLQEVLWLVIYEKRRRFPLLARTAGNRTQFNARSWTITRGFWAVNSVCWRPSVWYQLAFFQSIPGHTYTGWIWIHQTSLRLPDHCVSTQDPFSYWVILSGLLPLAQVILGLRGAKLGWVRKNPRQKKKKKAHISTVNIAVLPSLSDTVSLSSYPIHSESSTDLSFESSTLWSLSLSMKNLYPVLQKTISLTSHRIFVDLNVKATQ